MTNFSRGLWRNANCMDVDFYITRVFGPNDDGTTSAVVRYYLRRNGWEIGKPEVVRFRPSPQWSLIG